MAFPLPLATLGDPDFWQSTWTVVQGCVMTSTGVYFLLEIVKHARGKRDEWVSDGDLKESEKRSKAEVVKLREEMVAMERRQIELIKAIEFRVGRVDSRVDEMRKEFDGELKAELRTLYTKIEANAASTAKTLTDIAMALGRLEGRQQ